MAFTFKRPSNSNNNGSLLFLLDGLWKVKAEYIVLCLNGSAKFQNTSRASCHLDLMGNCRTCSHKPYQHSERFISSPRQVGCR